MTTLPDLAMTNGASCSSGLGNSMPRDGQEKGWLDTLFEGGLPQILAGPAGKAISRLVGAGAEIPAAWLEQRAQSIRDITEARSKVMETLAAKSAELGVSDPQLLDRGLKSLVGKAYREQENREQIARKTVDLLMDEPAAQESTGPTDDWLNVFEVHAANASSEELRMTWARVMAGEIRKPGSISLATLQLISILDRDVAAAVEVALSRVLNESLLLIGSIEGDHLDQMNLARSVGVFSQLGNDIYIRRHISDNRVAIFRFGDTCILARGEVGTEIEVHGSALTRLGRELLSVIRPVPNEDAITMLVEHLKQITGINSLERGAYIQDTQGRYVGQNLKTIWSRPKP